ncbi:MAG: ATP-grasp domain-containing protein [Prevotella sp.]|nr:ATP-grasp domain-containing protein [Prevotella sp.]
MSDTDKLVIIGSSHHNTYSMIRCFGESGVQPEVILYGKSDSFLLHSRFVKGCFVADNAEDALVMLKDNYKGAVVIACTDDIASLMDKEYDNLIQHFKFFNCGRNGRLTEYMKKTKQIAAAEQAGLRVPITIEASSMDIDLSNIPYPCILRPLESIHGGKNIQVCYSKKDIPSALNAFDNNVKLLVQEFVFKDYEIVLVGLSTAERIIIPAYIHKLRDTKGGTTYSLVKPIEDIPVSVVNSCKKLVAGMSYNGLFGIELMCKGDDYYFVEINLRNDATTYAVNVAGCNLPLAFWKNCHGENADEIFTSSIRQIYSIVEFNDFVSVLKCKVGIIKWFRECKASECKYFYSSVDPEPYKIRRKEFVSFLMKRIFKF